MRKIFALILTLLALDSVEAQVPQKIVFRIDTSLNPALKNLKPPSGFESPSGLTGPPDLESTILLTHNIKGIPGHLQLASYKDNRGIRDFNYSSILTRNAGDTISFRGAWSKVGIKHGFIYKLDNLHYINNSYYRNPAINNTNFYRHYFDINFAPTFIGDILLGQRRR
jgi:hypothetical protein